MELFASNFVFTYLLFPVIGFILGGLMFFIAKKNELLSNKKLIFYFLAAVILIALPALLGFIDYWFMPYAYIGLQVVYFFLGWYNLKILEWLIKDINKKPYYIEFLFVFVIMFAGAALFSLVFNLCNELQYGLWACTCVLPFIFTSVFRKAYHIFMDIPLEVYKTWSYYEQSGGFADSDTIDNNKITVIEMELFRQEADKKPLNIKVKASEDMPFGTWFKVFIDDYNKKSPGSPIVYTDSDDTYRWMFYTTTSFWGRKKYIDPTLTFAGNKIKEHRIVIAKRTQSES